MKKHYLIIIEAGKRAALRVWIAANMPGAGVPFEAASNADGDSAKAASHYQAGWRLADAEKMALEAEIQNLGGWYHFDESPLDGAAKPGLAEALPVGVKPLTVSVALAVSP